MTRYTAAALAAATILMAAGAPRAAAQPQVPGGGAASRPVFSPYLGLLGGYGNPGINYAANVLPQMQFQQQLGQVQQQLGSYSFNYLTGSTVDPNGLLPATGSVPVFNNTFGYFNRLYIGNGVASASGGGSGGGAFNRLGGFGSLGGGTTAAGFQRGGAANTFRPSFAAPASGRFNPNGAAGAAPAAPAAPARP